MKRYEYRTVALKQTGSAILGSKRIPDSELDDALNREGQDGWRFRAITYPSGAFGEASDVIVIFERELA
jgi:hypothetical protein